MSKHYRFRALSEAVAKEMGSALVPNYKRKEINITVPSGRVIKVAGFATMEQAWIATLDRLRSLQVDKMVSRR